MAQAELKTKANSLNVEDFLNSIKDDQQKKDAVAVSALMKQLTKSEPVMWGSSIVGFGQEHLIYESGRELDWFKVGFSPRKQNITLYVLRGGEENYKDLLEKLGKHSCGKGCLYIKRLDEVNIDTLEELITRSMTI